MTRPIGMVVIGLLCALSAAWGQAGGDKKKETQFAPPKPGAEHKLLAKLQGTWTAKVKAWLGPGDPTTSTGVMNRKMIMDGLFLQEAFTGEFTGMKFMGMGMQGYDVDRK